MRARERERLKEWKREKEQGRDSETLRGSSVRWQCLDSLRVVCHCRKIGVRARVLVRALCVRNRPSQQTSPSNSAADVIGPCSVSRGYMVGGAMPALALCVPALTLCTHTNNPPLTHLPLTHIHTHRTLSNRPHEPFKHWGTKAALCGPVLLKHSLEVQYHSFVSWQVGQRFSLPLPCWSERKTIVSHHSVTFLCFYNNKK